jgi:hypothetical protein
MLGVVTECFLIEESFMGSTAVHKITIAPFAQEMRRDTSLWGQLFGFRIISGSMSSMGFSFLTRRKTSGNFASPGSPFHLLTRKILSSILGARFTFQTQ